VLCCVDVASQRKAIDTVSDYLCIVTLTDLSIDSSSIDR